jgi:hypothetical protein
MPFTGYYDGVALAFLAMACLTTRPLQVACLIFLAAWTDERALIASSLIWLYHHPCTEPNHVPTQASYIAKSLLGNARTIAILSAWAGYFISRAIIGQYFDLSTGTRDIWSPVTEGDSLTILPISLLTQFEFLWIIIALGFMTAISAGMKLAPLLFAAGLGLMAVITLLVYDHSRAGAYAFPAIFITLKWLSLRETRHSFSKSYPHLLPCVAILCLLVGNFGIYANQPPDLIPTLPLPYYLIRSLLP